MSPVLDTPLPLFPPCRPSAPQGDGTDHAVLIAQPRQATCALHGDVNEALGEGIVEAGCGGAACRRRSCSERLIALDQPAGSGGQTYVGDRQQRRCVIVSTSRLLCDEQAGDRGAQALEFALVSPLIVLGMAGVLLVSILAMAMMAGQGLAQGVARQVALTGTAQVPPAYTLVIEPPSPKVGELFRVRLSHTVTLPLPGKRQWPLTSEAWGIRAPDP